MVPDITPQNPTLLPRNNRLQELYAGMGGRTSQQGYVADSVRQKFTSYEHDAETNLEFAQARYYSSSCGRFTSPDPLHREHVVDRPAVVQPLLLRLQQPGQLH